MRAKSHPVLLGGIGNVVAVPRGSHTLASGIESWHACAVVLVILRWALEAAVAFDAAAVASELEGDGPGRVFSDNARGIGHVSSA